MSAISVRDRNRHPADEYADGLGSKSSRRDEPRCVNGFLTIRSSELAMSIGSTFKKELTVGSISKPSRRALGAKPINSARSSR